MMRSIQLSWAWSLLNVGAMVGGIIAGPMARLYGRKICILFNCVPYVIGVLLMYFSSVAVMFILGRLSKPQLPCVR